ncbi:MAG TPA: hypothetical protein VIH57_06690 [Bacteroidales bacterium]
METNKLPIGIWTWYSVEDHLLFSDSFYQSTGIAKDWHYKFTTFLEIIHGNDLLQFCHDIEAMLRGAEPMWITYRIVKPNGSDQKVECFVISLSTEFKDVFDITGVCYEG